jgi:hypothetical protein
MPKKFDDMVKRIWDSLRGKKNPKTGKMYTNSDAYAMATAQWKKTYGTSPKREDFSDWRLLEFYMPIEEKLGKGNDFFIRGVAINETTTRNNVKYIAEELEKAAPSFRNKPILLDHENSVINIVGRTTENVNFDSNRKSIMFEAKIMDKNIREMINDGRITDVSIGARVKDLVENREEGYVTATGIEGVEISLVAVPGDPGANIASAIQNSLQLKESFEMAFVGKEVEKEEVDSNKLKGGKKMVEEGDINKEQEETEDKSKEGKDEAEEVEDKPDEIAEEKVKKTEIKLDLGLNEILKDLSKEVKDLKLKVSEMKVKEQEEMTPPSKEEEEEKPVETEEKMEDKTKGVIKKEEDAEESETGFIIEKAESGKGFQIYMDTNNLSEDCKFKRLRR